MATDVERVLGGVEPHLMVTDPPYGVSYDPAWRNQAGRSFRATGITAYLDKGGTLENAQLMAAHESPRGAHEPALS